jgi:hypothetical protein
MSTPDQDRVIEVVAAHEDVDPEGMSTRRILLILLVLAIIAVVAGRLLYQQGFDSKTVPTKLVGLWTTAEANYSDRYLELQPDSITFGTGGTSSIKYSIIGVVRQEFGEGEIYEIHFRGVDGANFSKEIVLAGSGDNLFFRSQPEVVWTPFKR